MIEEQDAGTALYYADKLRRVSEIIQKWRPNASAGSKLITNHPTEEPAKSLGLIPFGSMQGQAFGRESLEKKYGMV